MKSEQLQPKFGGMGKDTLWQIDDSIITGDLQAVQDSPTHVSIIPRVTMALERDEAAIGKDPKILGKGGLVAYTQ
ncbi:MAG UNVERIFIED_CONTAM: hypothetical protein LVR29_09635 [Microcystis novacekii LVE1205-3]